MAPTCAPTRTAPNRRYPLTPEDRLTRPAAARPPFHKLSVTTKRHADRHTASEKASHGERKASHGERKASHGERKASRGDRKASHGRHRDVTKCVDSGFS